MILKRGVPKLIRIWIVSLHISKENVQDYATHAQVRLVHRTHVPKCLLIEEISLNCNINQNLFSVDCHWSNWKLGECSVSCGDGVRENHRFKEQEELFGGAPCEGVASQTEACINRICPGIHMCIIVIKILSDIFYDTQKVSP